MKERLDASDIVNEAPLVDWPAIWLAILTVWVYGLWALELAMMIGVLIMVIKQ